MEPPRAPEALKFLLAAQLGTCIAALKAGKQDQVLRISSFVSALLTSYSSCFFFLSLQLSPVVMTFGMSCLRW